jgi:hypothetical protein
MGGEGSPPFRGVDLVSQTSQIPADARMRLLNANANEHPLRIKLSAHIRTGINHGTAEE